VTGALSAGDSINNVTERTLGADDAPLGGVLVPSRATILIQTHINGGRSLGTGLALRACQTLINGCGGSVRIVG